MLYLVSSCAILFRVVIDSDVSVGDAGFKNSWLSLKEDLNGEVNVEET